MDRRLLDYLPPVLRGVRELQAVNEAGEPALSDAWEALEEVLNSQFLVRAGSRGVERWEGELGILPRDTDSLEVRKSRIQAAWNTVLPYTLRWLIELAASVCGSTAEVRLYQEQYTVEVRVSKTAQALTDLESLAELLRESLPANMTVSCILVYNTWEAAGRLTWGNLDARTWAQIKEDIWHEPD